MALLRCPHEKRKIICALKYFAELIVDYDFTTRDNSDWWVSRLVQERLEQQAEKMVIEQIQREFSNTPFSSKWRGYAAFALDRRGSGAGDDDFDFVLITHSTIVAIELKNWNGKVLESDGQNWFIDGQSRPSPVNSIRLKAKKLAAVMKEKLGQELTPFIVSIVVMLGHIKEMEFTQDEEKSVVSLTEFLNLRFEHCYKKHICNPPRFNPLDHLNKYDSFFK